MKSFLGSFFGALIGIVVLGIILAVMLVGFIFSSVKSYKQDRKPVLAQNIVLKLDLYGSVPDQSTSSDFYFFNEEPLSLIEIAQSLRTAKTDPKVKAILLRAHIGGIHLLNVKPLRLALNDFKSSGKPVIFYTSDGFQDPSIAPYWLASQASEIWVQNRSSFLTTGISTDIPFYADLMKKVGVEAEFEQYKEYKNAANVFKENHLTPAHKEAELSLFNNLWEQAIMDISEGRKLPENQVKTLVKNVPYTAKTALKLGLIDGVGYYTDIKENLLNRMTDSTETKKTGSREEDSENNQPVFLSLKKYYKATGTPYKKGPVIALVSGQGEIINQRKNTRNLFQVNTHITGEAMVSALEKASKNKQVKAIILRLDTPGGAVSPSEEILHAVTEAQKRGKPVIVSMGSLAASGGYYIASRADKIVALPSTITGSIGVFGGKFFFGDSAKKLGVNVETIQVGGTFSSAYSPFKKFTPEQKNALREELKNIYDSFILHVSEGRHLSLAKTEEIAKGRVWTGQQAQKLGLVDELGGLNKAIEVAKKVVGIDRNASITLQQFPRKLSETEVFLNLLDGNISTSLNAITSLSEVLENPQIRHLIKLNKTLTQQQKNQLLYNPGSPSLSTQN